MIKSEYWIDNKILLSIDYFHNYISVLIYYALFYYTIYIL